MALKDTKLDSNGAQIANCFQKKKEDNCPAAWGSTSRPRLWCAWVKPVCLARRPIATFLVITWPLGSSSLQPLEQNHSCAPAVNSRNCIFILFTTLKIRFPKTNSLRIVALQEKRGWRPAPSVTILGWHHLLFFFVFLWDRKPTDW